MGVASWACQISQTPLECVGSYIIQTLWGLSMPCTVKVPYRSGPIRGFRQLGMSSPLAPFESLGGHPIQNTVGFTDALHLTGPSLKWAHPWVSPARRANITGPIRMHR
jgi:hypothetical protein